MRLRITEIFHSIQGETSRVGLPTAFIRLTGCPLRCVYCDTAYAFQGGAWWTIDDVLSEIKKYQTPYVTVTGGEPLAQKASIELLKKLCDANYHVSLETSGALSVSEVDERVKKIIDVKTPDSKEVQRNLFENFKYLSPQDEIKFVICSREDYVWAKDVILGHDLKSKASLLFSPSYKQLSPRDLAEWILADHLPVRIQIQLHKVLWGEEPGR
ncbi:MAG: hypothetical protein ACD_44C00379G0001 [uncultured bacterium]|nr:MAG: hypothetical protein ACD_44C00379G0001 [uncultured bacterium]